MAQIPAASAVQDQGLNQHLVRLRSVHHHITLKGMQMQIWGLAIALLVGFLLRFWNLDLKPLWLDETITLLFALGHRYEDIPRETLLPLTDLLNGLTWQPQSWGAIAQTLREQSTHPPLFFGLMHGWLGLLKDSGLSLRWQVRSLPALFGVAEIAAIYGLNRAAFSHRAGLFAAGLLAVSPFAVYLSQEARHYTLPMLVMTLSMIPLVQICRADASQRPQNPWLWIAWMSLNSLGFYIHYFCLLPFIAQAITLLTVLQRRLLGWASIAIGGVGLSLVPWLPVLLGHTQRSETDWLQFDGGGILDWLGPIARLLAGGIMTVVMLPVEEQPLAVMVVNGLGMLAIATALGRVLWRRTPRLFHDPKTHDGAVVLGVVLAIIWAEYLILVYGLHRDLTLAPRYNFVFYPLLCALLAASLTETLNQNSQQSKGLLPWILVVGIVSTGCVVNNLAFLKPFQPGQIAQRFLQQSPSALVVIQTYESSQDVALGLSSALAVQQLHRAHSPQIIQWGFVATGTTKPMIGSLPSTFTLWRVSALHQAKMEPLVRSLPQRPGQTEALTLTCVPQQPSHPEMGVQYQSFRCMTGHSW